MNKLEGIKARAVAINAPLNALCRARKIDPAKVAHWLARKNRPILPDYEAVCSALNDELVARERRILAHLRGLYPCDGI